ncbi:GFA family protein [Altererythrobacter sp. FM1]|uniref:GFA family protein n=1 Tax=Tsuneonella flava TaxID=2055955 RepID=UPI000C80A4BB|nr:GFA family protein [Tsuneonella flava]ROT95002.1 GFA family protein [Altererythrobacter sp. FM1]
MTDTPHILHGKCQCGAVQVELTSTKQTVEACHCSMCRRLNGGGPLFSLAGAKPDDLKVTGADHVSTYHSSEWAERAFCDTCGATLWYHLLPGEGHFSLSSGLFDLPEGYTLNEQIFIDEKPAWYDLAQDTPKKTGADIFAEAKEAGFTFD